jgi:hypothetical protein
MSLIKNTHLLDLTDEKRIEIERLGYYHRCNSGVEFVIAEVAPMSVRIQVKQISDIQLIPVGTMRKITRAAFQYFTGKIVHVEIDRTIETIIL